MIEFSVNIHPVYNSHFQQNTHLQLLLYILHIVLKKSKAKQ